MSDQEEISNKLLEKITKEFDNDGDIINYIPNIS